MGEAWHRAYKITARMPVQSQKSLNIQIGIRNEPLENSDPQHQRHEGMPNALRSMPSKDIVMVNVPMTIDCDNLLDLPERMHRHQSIGLANITFPDNKPLRGVSNLKRSESLAKIIYIVKCDACYIFMRNHVIEHELTSAMVSHKTEFFDPRLGHDMHWHGVHSWKEVSPKVTRDLSFLDLFKDLFLNKGQFVLGCEHLKRVVPGRRPFARMSMCKRPEAFTKPNANGLNKWLIGMIN